MNNHPFKMEIGERYIVNIQDMTTRGSKSEIDLGAFGVDPEEDIHVEYRDRKSDNSPWTGGGRDVYDVQHRIKVVFDIDSVTFRDGTSVGTDGGTSLSLDNHVVLKRPGKGGEEVVADLTWLVDSEDIEVDVRTDVITTTRFDARHKPLDEKSTDDMRIRAEITFYPWDVIWGAGEEDPAY